VGDWAGGARRCVDVILCFCRCCAGICDSRCCGCPPASLIVQQGRLRLMTRHALQAGCLIVMGRPIGDALHPML
jgi:hypothetical protein